LRCLENNKSSGTVQSHTSVSTVCYWLSVASH